MTTWAWCRRRSTVALAIVLGISSSSPAARSVLTRRALNSEAMHPLGDRRLGMGYIALF